MPSTEQDQIFFRLDLVRALTLHRWLAAGILTVAVALAVAYVLISSPRYVAQSLVYIQPAPPRMMETAPTQHWPYDSNTYESYIQQQIHNVTRPDVLLEAVRKMPVGVWRQPRESEQGAADRLGRTVEIARVGTGYQVSITAKARTADLAAQIANTLAASFVESASRELRSGDAQRITILTEERDRVVKELTADRSEQEDLNKKLGVAAISTAALDPYDDQVNSIRAELVRAREANDDAAARLTSMGTDSAASSAALNAQADDIASADPGLVSMKTSLNSRRAILISQMANLTPNHPQYKQDAEELAQINASLEAMMKDLRAKAAQRIQQKLCADLERTSGVESRLNTQLAQLSGAAGGATPRLQRANDLATDIQRLQNRFTVVDTQLRNLTMENDAPGADYISAPAVPPLHSSETTILRNAFVLVFGGLIMATLAALVASNLDQRVYVGADVERVLGFGPLAQLPDFYDVSDGVADEYMLRLAAAIEHAHQQGGVKSLVFTGVTSGAGTTTIVSRIRTMLETMGRPTLLVDASGSTPPDPAPQSETPAATGLATSERGRRPTALLQRMAKETGEKTIVLTDTAPLLVSGETEYLARFVDAAIVVIESGSTTRAQLREVAYTLQHLEVGAVGFVLNRIAMDKATPAFRQSVKAVERHVEAQSLSYARRTVKTRSKPQPDPESSEPAPATQSESSQPKRSITPQAEPVAAESQPVPSQPDIAASSVASHSVAPQPQVEIPQAPSSTPTPVDEKRVASEQSVITTPEFLAPTPLTPRPLRRPKQPFGVRETVGIKQPRPVTQQAPLVGHPLHTEQPSYSQPVESPAAPEPVIDEPAVARMSPAVQQSETPQTFTPTEPSFAPEPIAAETASVPFELHAYPESWPVSGTSPIEEMLQPLSESLPQETPTIHSFQPEPYQANPAETTSVNESSAQEPLFEIPATAPLPVQETIQEIIQHLRIAPEKPRVTEPIRIEQPLQFAEPIKVEPQPPTPDSAPAPRVRVKPVRVAPRRDEPQRVYSIPQPGRHAESAHLAAPLRIAEPVRVAEPMRTAESLQNFEPIRPFAAAPQPVAPVETTIAQQHTASWLDLLRVQAVAANREPSAPASHVSEFQSNYQASATPADDDAVHSAASRLGGLRNLIDALGLNNLHKDGNGLHEPEFDIRDAQQPQQHTIFSASQPESDAASAPSNGVVAEPEFIYPKVATDAAQREPEPIQPTPLSTRQDRWVEATDDITTLPSWRGQYRKR
jgi:uncharacterized protein involved in exopolysaccharide biosynthesis/Mrp family chromosome partitioning ATPase